MRKKIVSSFFLLLFSMASIKNYAKSNKINMFLSKHPYALLGSDFGLLNSDDLSIGSCVARPAPFDPQISSNYSYWQCFETKTSTFFCDGHEYNEDFQNFSALLVISTKKDNVYHEYLSRRALDLDVCKEFMNDWKNLTKSKKYVCVSGSYINQKQDESGNFIHYWVFDKFKTKKGCMSYFKYGCNLNYQLKKGKCRFLNYKDNH